MSDLPTAGPGWRDVAVACGGLAMAVTGWAFRWMPGAAARVAPLTRDHAALVERVKTIEDARVREDVGPRLARMDEKLDHVIKGLNKISDHLERREAPSA